MAECFVHSASNIEYILMVSGRVWLLLFWRAQTAGLEGSNRKQVTETRDSVYIHVSNTWSYTRQVCG